MRGRRWAALLVLSFALVVVGAACGAEDDPSAGAGGGVEGAEVVAPEEGGVAEGEAAQGDEGGITLAGVPEAGPKIVKTASIALEVAEDEFDGAFERVSLIAGAHGGFVASSVTEGTDRRSGSITLRVPAGAFEEALAEVRRLGEVESEEISGDDVTAEFVDLQARLRHWEAQEAVLLRLMGEASSIEDSITVQRNLQDVQLAIEQLRGRLRVLRDRTELSTISVGLRESGAAALGEEPSFARAWHEAVRGFLSVVTATVVALGYVVPIGLLALVGFLLYRRVRARRTAPVPSG